MDSESFASTAREENFFIRNWRNFFLLLFRAVSILTKHESFWRGNLPQSRVGDLKIRKIPWKSKT